ncbi:hypothetical protein HHL28_14355 [Aerophototrophica crusticola]|uniref:Uncharacterized protein n=1 Tax=Aerophototrophica crusticola TaxID=1709002 RepID=A0A858R9F8_9PROT|nr:hypothetical protein HHL28_14355 [Rhodospirillaceae bacterium B3]
MGGPTDKETSPPPDGGPAGPWDDFFDAPGADFPEREQPDHQDHEPF